MSRLDRNSFVTGLIFQRSIALAEPQTSPNTQPPQLRRVIGLPLLVLYGLGITIGA
ncbi:MAG: hypothetical protein HQ479_07095, partial [Rhodobacter sp.]|nr:hypothetical protein [Rhodobacter sp.]